MKVQLLIILFLLSAYDSYSQKQKSTLVINVPFIWNNSEGVYYSLGSRKMPTGNAISHGISADYSIPFYKGLYIKAGIGYFRQSFGIRRPIYFYSPFDLNYHTESYHYNTIQLLTGIGYKLKLNNKYALHSNINYNFFYSYSQKYIVNKEYKTWQVNKKRLSLGSMMNICFGLERGINSKLSVGLNAVLPTRINWKDDSMFIKYDYSNDTQKVAWNKLSFGSSVSIYWHF